MRILVLHSRYLSEAVSGENRVVEDEARLLREGGHEVHVWEPSVKGAAGLRLLQTGAETIWSRNAARRVRELIRTHRPDIVHCHNLFPALSPAVLHAAAKETPVVLTLHNYRLLCLPSTFMRDGQVCEDCLGRVPWRGAVYRCYRESLGASSALAASITLHRSLATFDRVSLYLAVSSFLKQKYAQAGWPAERVRVKANFAWASSRRRGPGDYFLYMGRLSPEKGVPTLLDAWGTLSAQLLVVGDGPEAARLRAKAPPSVRFLGPVPVSRVQEMLAGARALLVPSRWYEGQPRAILEAYAAGVPVIASRIGGLPEVVADGDSGVLLSPNDAREWTEAAGRLLSDQTSQRLGDGALRQWHDRYSPERALEGLEGAYQQVLSTH